MPVEVTILGAGEAERLGTRIVDHSDGRLGDQVADAIYDAHRGISAAVRAGAITHLPKRNGLAEEVARCHINISHLPDGVRVVADHKYNLQGLDRGLNVHPLFGNKRHWYGQHVRAGWFTDTLERHQHTTTRKYVERACEKFAEDLEG